MQQTVVFVDNELAKIRTGRANPDMFSKILVNYYENETPLNQVANVSLMEVLLLAFNHLIKQFLII
ncbi:MAG: hypothetical protein CM1200mP1_03560 [Candidatus Neomarinimicrobiota bacterium]|nr:MAG: hypothetical protein CM1200mP1_03560 [Candidatus Neomarinimicrobiota bacterium]